VLQTPPAAVEGRCAGACGTCLYATPGVTASKICCCVADCVSYRDWCVRAWLNFAV
jgi:hypothetical protein